MELAPRPVVDPATRLYLRCGAPRFTCRSTMMVALVDVARLGVPGLAAQFRAHFGGGLRPATDPLGNKGSALYCGQCLRGEAPSGPSDALVLHCAGTMDKPCDASVLVPALALGDFVALDGALKMAGFRFLHGQAQVGNARIPLACPACEHHAIAASGHAAYAASGPVPS